MTLTMMQVAGDILRCEGCRKVLATQHDGRVHVKTGKTSVVFQSGSIQCPSCGRITHVSLAV